LLGQSLSRLGFVHFPGGQRKPEDAMGDFYDPSLADEGHPAHGKSSGGWSETLRHFGVEAKRAAERTKHSILQKVGEKQY